jgi:capsule polysaccharide export protein KpsE/RkpR
LGSMAGDLLGLRSSSDLFIGILQSRSVQDQLIGRFELRKVYSAGRMEDTRRALDRHTTLSSDRKSGIITISVEDHSPERAAAMAGEYIGELNRVVTDLNTSSAHRERAFLEERLVQVKHDLQSSEKNFSDFASKNTALDIPDQGKAMIEGLASLEGESIATETELQGLKQIYADGNVQVRATQAKADRLQGELKKYLGARGGDGPANDRPDAQPLYPSLRELPVLGVSYADLFRDTKIEEAVFQALTQEYELAKVQEAKETPSVKVLDSPDIPDKEIYPPKLTIIAVGTILAIVASVLWILGKDSWDRADEADPQKVLTREVIGTLQGQIQRAIAKSAAPNRVGSKLLGRFRREEASGKCWASSK